MIKATKKLVLPLFVLAFSVSTATADCSKATLSGSTANVIERLDAMTACIAELKEESAALRNSILISPNTCETLGSGWRTYTDAYGRFVIGAGSTYELGKTGGETSVTLKEKQMPSHSHVFVGDTVPAGGWGGSINRSIGVGDHVDWREYKPTGTIQATGGSQPHNNMPPYIAMYFCKKG